MSSKKRTLAQTQMITKTGKVKRKRPAGDYQRGREMTHAVGRELKAFDVATASPAFTTAGTFQLLNVPVNGAELYQRVGRKIYMKSIQLRGFIQNAATAVQDVLRVVLFYDSQPNAAASNQATLLQNSNAAAATDSLSGLNLTNRERFKIIRDYLVAVPSVTNTAGVLTNPGFPDQVNTLCINWYIKLKGLETIFNATNGGTIADITSGSLYLAFFSETTSNAWAMTFNSRLRYYDT